MREQTSASLAPKDVQFTFKSKRPHMNLRMLNTRNTGTLETRHLAWIYFSGEVSCPNDETIRSAENCTPAYYFAGAPDEQGWKFNFSDNLIPSNKWDTAVRYTVHVSLHAIFRDIYGRTRQQHFVFNCSGKAILKTASTPIKMRPVHGWSGACQDEKTETEKVFNALSAL